MLYSVRGLVAVGVVALWGCSDSPPGDPLACASNTECEAGWICQAAMCAKLCTTQGDCEMGQICGGVGICQPPQGGSLPEVTSVAGNDIGDPTRIDNGLLINGTTLGQAVFELQSSTAALPLPVVRQDDNSAEVTLPADVVSGVYVLVATNQAGSSQANVTLTLPEITGEGLITRINAEATTDLAFGLLPTGTAGNQVAAGDHAHDTDYYLRGQADSMFATQASAAGHITLSDVDRGGNYVLNPYFVRGATNPGGPDGWTVVTNGNGMPPFTVLDVSSNSRAGPYAVENGQTTRVTLTNDSRIPIDHGASYHVVGAARNVLDGGADGEVAIGVRMWDAAGTELLNGSSWHVYAAANVTITQADGWRSYSANFGGKTATAIPAAARSMSVAAILNGEGTGVGTQIHQVQGLGIFHGRDERFIPNFPYVAPSAGDPEFETIISYAVCASRFNTMRYLEIAGGGQDCATKCADSESAGSGCLGAFTWGGNRTPFLDNTCSDAGATSIQYCCCTW